MEISKEVILDYLQTHKSEFEKKFLITKIGLFGSFVRDEFTQDSDIDLLIKMKQKDFDKRFDFKLYLENVFGRKVDVGYEDSIRSFIKKEIEKEIIYV